MERVTGHRAIMSVVYDWTRQAACCEDVQARDLGQGRDYTYVADIADGIRTILGAPNLPHDLYNLPNGVWFTFRQILEVLQEVSPGIRVVELPLSEPGGQQGAPLRGPLSGHRIFADLHCLPKYDLRPGLTEYLQWRRDSGFHDCFVTEIDANFVTHLKCANKHNCAQTNGTRAPFGQEFKYARQ